MTRIIHFSGTLTKMYYLFNCLLRDVFHNQDNAQTTQWVGITYIFLKSFWIKNE